MAKKIAPVHPGEVLREDFMVPTNTSINKLSADLRVPLSRVSEIVNGTRAITDTALRLARHLGTTADFWLGLQMQYDLEKAKDELEEIIEKEVRPRAA
jgi:addiction module HigA family antidote